MRYLLILLVSLMLSACASDMHRQDTPGKAAIDTLQLAEPVDRVYLPLLDSWAQVDRSHIILYQNQNKAYLVELERPISLAAATQIAIGVRQTNNYLTKFDYVVIDGQKYYIDTIRPLTREQAEALS